ncbi:DUF481 domain-containing protein [Stutzerimonas nosocomialis]|uniref:DUF481 domain-containing protein n=1 Tax=Stutzerimonas nosocomialis TaxID=1056496 RepID=UPI001109CB96|nr:DUF481 domain-containing protein [Stutzerimonas nosocomialis]TLX53230.1 DUF481 domain-containing protein [Stutzerimonas nosocomialis]
MLTRSLLCVTLAALSSPVLADTVWLKNGDRLTGNITLLDGGKLLLETSYGGSIPLRWSQISTLESDRELLIKQDDAYGQITKTIQAGEPGYVTLVNGNQPVTVELSSISQIIQPKPLIEDFTWTGNVDVAFDYKRAENDSEDHDVALKTSARHGLWRHNAQAKYTRDSRNEVETADNWEAEYALDRFLTEQWFWQGRVDYKRDNIEEISRQRTLGTGPGYQFWDNELGAFSLASLFNRRDYEFADGSSDSFYAATIKWDYNRFFAGKTFELFTHGEIGKPLASVAEYSLDAQAGLRYKVTDWASLNIRAEKDIVSGSDQDLDETRYLMGFGVGW